MSIQDQLSLASNGGVYFEGMRMDPSNDAYLFVGLGGTGADALLRIKNEMKTRMKLPKDPDTGALIADVPPNMAFLAIDSDERTQNKRYGKAAFDEFGSEYVSIKIDEITDVISNMKHNQADSPLWNWLDDGINPSSGLIGAGGIRQIGRMMLIYSFNRVRDRLRVTLRNIAENNPPNTYIIIVSGIAGGTGSGTFLDLAFLLRYLASTDIGMRNVQMMGYLVLPDLNLQNGGDANSLNRNGFASLKELEYWMNIGVHNEPFEQQYAVDFRLHADLPPFDYCHLISAQNRESHLVSYKQALTAIAENIFAYLVSETAYDAQGNTAMFSMYSNINEYIRTIDEPYPASHRYLSIGARKLEIPFAEITTLIAARVFDVMKPLFSYRPTKQTFDAEAFRMGVTDDQLRTFVQKRIGPSPLADNKFKYEDVWGVTNRVYSLIEDYHANIQPIMVYNASNLPQVYEGTILRELESFMKRNDRGPCYAAKFIKSHESFCLIATLEGYRTHFDDLATQESDNAEKKKAALSSVHISGMNRILLGQKKALNAYLEVAHAYDQSMLLWFMYDKLARAVEVLIKRLQKYFDKIFKPLDDVLQMLPGIFADNLKYIETHGDEAGWLISPLKFEKENQAAVREKVIEAAKGFLESMYKSIAQWIGFDLDKIDAQVNGVKTVDVPGFIANFIQDNFNTVLTISLEDLIQKKLLPAENFNNHVKHLLIDLNEQAIPLYRASNAHKSAQIREFAYMAIPLNCHNILNIALENEQAWRAKVKKSDEKSKITVVKVMYGMPLYAFARAEEMELAYAQSSEKMLGVHLRSDWLLSLASPIPQGAWSSGYSCQATQERNEKYGKLFDNCVSRDVIRLSEDKLTAKLFCADQNFDPDTVLLSGSLHERLNQITNLRLNLWSGKFINLVSCGSYRLAEEGLLANIRENTLRFYTQCQMLEKQGLILEKVERLSKNLIDTELYAHALIANLILTSYPRRVLRKSETDAQPRTLISLVEHQNPLSSYYLEFKAFSSGLAADETQNITVRWDRLIENCQVQAKRDALRERLGAVGSAFANCEEHIRRRIQMVNFNEARALQDECQFYMDVQDICQTQLGFLANHFSAEGLTASGMV